jgi:hypothetical protein
MLVPDKLYLEATFDELQNRHGGVIAYAVDYLGVSSSALKAHEHELLEALHAASVVHGLRKRSIDRARLRSHSSSIAV